MSAPISCVGCGRYVALPPRDFIAACPTCPGVVTSYKCMDERPVTLFDVQRRKTNFLDHLIQLESLRKQLEAPENLPFAYYGAHAQKMRGNEHQCKFMIKKLEEMEAELLKKEAGQDKEETNSLRKEIAELKGQLFQEQTQKKVLNEGMQEIEEKIKTIDVVLDDIQVIVKKEQEILSSDKNMEIKELQEKLALEKGYSMTLEEAVSTLAEEKEKIEAETAELLEKILENEEEKKEAARREVGYKKYIQAYVEELQRLRMQNHQEKHSTYHKILLESKLEELKEGGNFLWDLVKEGDEKIQQLEEELGNMKKDDEAMKEFLISFLTTIQGQRADLHPNITILTRLVNGINGIGEYLLEYAEKAKEREDKLEEQKKKEMQLQETIPSLNASSFINKTKVDKINELEDEIKQLKARESEMQMENDKLQKKIQKLKNDGNLMVDLIKEGDAKIKELEQEMALEKKNTAEKNKEFKAKFLRTFDEGVKLQRENRQMEMEAKKQLARELQIREENEKLKKMIIEQNDREKMTFIVCQEKIAKVQTLAADIEKLKGEAAEKEIERKKFLAENEKLKKKAEEEEIKQLGLLFEQRRQLRDKEQQQALKLQYFVQRKIQAGKIPKNGLTPIQLVSEAAQKPAATRMIWLRDQFEDAPDRKQ